MNIPEEIIKKLQNTQHLVVFTGAGVSAESGIPTFRDALTGLWKKFDVEDLATQKAFKQDPALVWGWYEWRRMKVLQAKPNPAHLAIAALVGLVPRLTVITQNVDDLHERAGNVDVIHLHGRLHQPICFACKRPFELSSSIPDEPVSGRHVEPPRCKCGGRIRPGVVWFGENLPESEWNVANDAAYRCDAFLCIGTSSLVEPAARLPHLAIKHGALVIQVNINPTSLDDRANLNLHGAAGDVMPCLIDKVWGTTMACS